MGQHGHFLAGQMRGRCIGKTETEEQGEGEHDDQDTDTSGLRVADGQVGGIAALAHQGNSVLDGQLLSGDDVAGVGAVGVRRVSHGVPQRVDFALQTLVLGCQLLVEADQLFLLGDEVVDAFLQVLDVDLFAETALLGRLAVLDEPALALELALLRVRQVVEGLQALFVLFQTAAGQRQQLFLGQLRGGFGEDRGRHRRIGKQLC